MDGCIAISAATEIIALISRLQAIESGAEVNPRSAFTAPDHRPRWPLDSRVEFAGPTAAPNQNLELVHHQSSRNPSIYRCEASS